MTTYIITITLLDCDNNIDYKIIEAVHSDKETAKAEATRRAELQKKFWPGSFFTKLGKGKVGLQNGPEGFSKIYEIVEMEMK